DPRFRKHLLEPRSELGCETELERRAVAEHQVADQRRHELDGRRRPMPDLFTLPRPAIDRLEERLRIELGDERTDRLLREREAFVEEAREREEVRLSSRNERERTLCPREGPLDLDRPHARIC